MPLCGPSNAIPSCAATPSVGFGSSRCGSGSICGLGSGFGSGETVPAASLGVVQGVFPSCLNQLPAQQLTVQPPSFNLVMPGAVMVAGPEPLCVGGYTPCVSSGISGIYGYGGVPCLGSSVGYSQGLLGSYSRGVSCSPCGI